MEVIKMTLLRNVNSFESYENGKTIKHSGNMVLMCVMSDGTTKNYRLKI
jgi:hypothetical protein